MATDSVRTELAVEIGRNSKQPLVLSNPVMAAAGAFGYGSEYSKLIDIETLGAIVSPTITGRPRRGVMGTRLVETVGGILTANGYQNVGVRRVIREWAPVWAGWKVPVFVSITGADAEDFGYLAGELDGVPGVGALELNVPDPDPWNERSDGGPGHVAGIVAAVRQRSGLPIAVKLSPQSRDIRASARAAEAEGADAITAINPVAGLKIDTKTGRPTLAAGWGGLSGPAIHSIAVWHVYLVSQAVEIPVIGVGGIASTEDALEHFMAGASAVQVGAATFVEPSTAARIATGLPEAIAARGFERLSDLVGCAHGELRPDPSALEQEP